MHLYFNGPKSVFLQVPSLAGRPLPEISYSSSATNTPTVNTVKFGNGYEQRSMDSAVNNNPLSLSVTFTTRSLGQIREIVAFFIGGSPVYNRQPNEYFYYIPPDPYDIGGLQTPLKFTCTGPLSNVFEQANSFSVTATFNQVFDP